MHRLWTLLIVLIMSSFTWVAAAETIERDCPDCPDLVLIPAGSFQMGEKPGRHVTIQKSFAMGATLVTQGQWQALMGKNPSEFTACGNACPVENVSWEDAQIFILRLNAKTGKHYRLPTEAEWEYTCRAGSKTVYCGGNVPGAVGWFEGNSDNSTHPVATKKPNAWGLFDMSGNLWQWVGVCYTVSVKLTPPVNGSTWDQQKSYAQFTDTCSSRVIRGGSWHNSEEELTVTRRSAEDPTVRVHSVGLRVARSL